MRARVCVCMCMRTLMKIEISEITQISSARWEGQNDLRRTDALLKHPICAQLVRAPRTYQLSVRREADCVTEGKYTRTQLRCTMTTGTTTATACVHMYILCREGITVNSGMMQVMRWSGVCSMHTADVE